MSSRGGQCKNKRLRKDYSQRHLENPFYRQKSPSRNYSGRTWKIIIWVSLAALIALFWLFLMSSVFLIRNINVQGQERISGDEIKALATEQLSRHRLGFLSQSNLWLFDREKFSGELKDEYKLQAVKVQRRLFHTIKIIISERPYNFIWSEDNNYYHLDKDGLIIDQLTLLLPSDPAAATSSSSTPDVSSELLSAAKQNNSSTYPIIVNSGAGKITSDRINLDSKYFACARDLFIAIKNANNSEISLDVFILDGEYNTLKARMIGGAIIYLNPQDDYTKQIRNLMVLLKGDYKSQIKKKVDLRYGDKIFYE